MASPREIVPEPLPPVGSTPSTAVATSPAAEPSDLKKVKVADAPPGHPAPAPVEKPAPLCPKKLILFCSNLFIGLIFSQLIPEWMPKDDYTEWKHAVKVITMFHLSYIMINVGFEFDIDKSNLKQYGKDYLVAATAATFPWIFVSIYFMAALGDHNVPWRMALLAGRFAAPTSAGILFTMLEAAGMKETWLFQKARILAIFDDLDTLLLMVPLKAIIVGIKWELLIDLFWVVLCLVIMYKYLHAVDIPSTWWGVASYAAAITIVCEMVHFMTHDPSVDVDSVVETIHLEILLPAFTIGCIVKNPHGDHAVGTHGMMARNKWGSMARMQVGMSKASKTINKIKNVNQEKVKGGISAVFMVLVGLSMPSLFKPLEDDAHRRLASSDSSSSSDDDVGAMPAQMIVLHVVLVSILMNVGKLFPSLCYRDEAHQKTRLALAIGMMPRGEVCAGIIVNAIALGASGASITIAVLCLAVNMSFVSGFIFCVKSLSAAGERAMALETQPAV